MHSMRAKLTVLSALVVGMAGGALVSACQTYDFEPVEPLALAQTTVGADVAARQLKPNLMVLLDTSGSMKTAVNPSLAACQTPSGAPCGDPLSGVECDTTKCPTRWTELQGAMATFLANSGTSARIGLTTYPQTGGGAGSCGPSTTVRFPVPELDDADTAGLQQAATSVATVIQGIPNSGAANSPVGGTPTGASITFVGKQEYLQHTDRNDFILLLTDGLPNCNSQNVNSGIQNPTACKCTLSACNTSASERIGCLDDTETVKAITGLRAQDTSTEFKDIKTIVVGFGAETSVGSAADTLNAMAEAGGFPRTCRKAEDCGAGDTCDTAKGLCGRRFYLAANQAELSKALKDIIDLLGNKDPCLLALDAAQAPSDPKLIIVYVNNEPVASGADTWTLTAQGVQFQGAMCERIKSSTTANPITLEARAVQKK